jgi:hypothetical protein
MVERTQLPSLWQTHGVEVRFAGDPAVLAVDLYMEPNFAGIRYAETDVVLVRTPGNRSLPFEVVNLRIRLDHDVLGNESIFRFGKESYESHLTATHRICLDLVVASGELALGGQARPVWSDLSLNPVDNHAVEDANIPRPHPEFQHIMGYSLRLLSADGRAWLIAVDLLSQEGTIGAHGSTQRGELAIYQAENLDPPSTIRR